MKYFYFRKKVSSDHQIDELLGVPNLKVFPRVLGKFRPSFLSSKEYLNRRNSDLSFRLDFLENFICFEGTYEIEYDWILLDAYYFSYHEDLWPVELNGWLISPRFKELIDKHNLIIGKEQSFDACKLKYQGDYLDYYICQYLDFDNNIVNLDNSSVLLLPEGVSESDPTSFKTHNEFRDLISWYKKVEDFKVKICLNEHVDVLRFPLMIGAYASEIFKNLVEKHNISGYEFWSVDNAEFHIMDTVT